MGEYADYVKTKDAQNANVAVVENNDYSKVNADLTAPTPSFNLQSEINKVLQPTVDELGKHWSNGAKDVHAGLTYARAGRGEISTQDAKSIVDQNDVQNETPDMTFAAKALGPLVEMGPNLWETLSSAGEGAALGAGTGAGAGAVLAAPTAEAAAPITVPAASLAGAAMGGESAAITTAGEIAYGNLLKGALDAGVPEKSARNIALIGGISVGVLQIGGGGAIGNAMLKAAEKTVLKTTGKSLFENAVSKYLGRVAPHLVKSYVKNTLLTGTDLTAQNLTTTLVSDIGKAMSGVNPGDWGKHLTDSLSQAWKLAATLGAVHTGLKTKGGGKSAQIGANVVKGAITTATEVHAVPDLTTLGRAIQTHGALLNKEELPADYRDLSESSIHGLAALRGDDHIKAMIERRREAHADHVDEIARKGEDLKHTVKDVASMVNTKGETVDLTPHSESQYETGVSKAKHLSKTFGATIASFSNNIRRVGQMLSPKGEREAFVHMVTNDLNAASDRADAQNRHLLITLRDSIEASTGKGFGKVLKTIMQDADPNGLAKREGLFGKKTFPEYADQEGKPVEFKGSPSHAAFVLAALKSAEHDTNLPLRKTLQEMGYTTEKEAGAKSTESVLREALDDRDPMSRKIMDGIVDWYDGPAFDAISEHYYHITGEELPKVAGYFGQLSRAVSEDDPYSLEHFQRTTGLTNQLGLGFPESATGEKALTTNTKERVDTPIPLKMRNLYLQAAATAQNTAQLNFADAAKVLGETFGDHEVTTAIDRNYGKSFRKLLQHQIKDIIEGTSERAGFWLNALNKIMSTYGGNFIRWQPKRYFTHAVQAVSYMMADVGNGKTLPTLSFLAGVHDYLIHPQQSNDNLWRNSTALQEKYASKDTATQQTGTSAGSFHAGEVKNTLNSIGDVFLNKGAQLADQMGMHAVYKYMTDNGASHEEAMAAADAAMKRTQFTHSAAELSPIERIPWLRPISQFSNYPNKVFQETVNAWRDAWNHPSPETFYNYARTVAIAKVGSMAFQSVDLAWKLATEPDDKKKDDYVHEFWMRTLAAPLPLNGEHVATSGFDFAHDMATRALNRSGADVEPTHYFHAHEGVIEQVVTNSRDFVRKSIDYATSETQDAAHFIDVLKSGMGAAPTPGGLRDLVRAVAPSAAQQAQQEQ